MARSRSQLHARTAGASPPRGRYRKAEDDELLPVLGRLVDARLTYGYLARREAEHREAAQLRAERSTHRRLILDRISEIREGRGGVTETAELVAELERWPSAAALRSLSIEQLRLHVAEANELAKRLWNIAEEMKEMSGRPDENVRSHIQDTTDDSSGVCNPSSNQDCLEKQKSGWAAADKPDALENFTPRRAYMLASSDMRLRIDLRKGDRFAPNWYDIEMAAHDLRPDLGISPSCWAETLHVMGGPIATLALLVTDARREHPDDPVLNPGGYLRGMTRAFRRGKLNVLGSLLGLSARRRLEVA